MFHVKHVGPVERTVTERLAEPVAAGGRGTIFGPRLDLAQRYAEVLADRGGGARACSVRAKSTGSGTATC